ncbi:translocation and assembly module lipoprotein TamL [Planktosalinus lacus]|nr:BamA/TamA family outer membrane protein [Planktosalinus lacus]
MKTKHINIFLVIVIVLAMQSCNVKRFIPEGELLYTGADVEVSSDKLVKDISEVQTEIENLIRPEPNSKILGSRLGLLVHYKSQRENPGFINKFLNKRIGEEPVYESDVNTIRTEDLIRNRLENRGFFFSRVGSAMEEKPEKKTAEAKYVIKLTEPYLLENYIIDKDSLNIYNDIKASLSSTKIEEEMRFDLAALRGERERIDEDLKNKGYYNFTSNFLIFEADTNQYKNKRFDLFLRLKKDVPKKSIKPYRITKVNVYPNHGPDEEYTAQDSTRLDQKSFFQKEEFFLPKRLLPYIRIEEGDNFNPDNSRNTSRRLTSLGAYKFVNIRYDEIDSLATDSLGILEANIFLSPLNKRAIRAELQAVTKSNNFAGPTLSATLTNRNLFKGGEILNLTVKGGYEFQLASGEQSGLNSILVGAHADLIFPRVLFPVSINNDWFKYAIPKTKISIGADYLSRSKLYSLTSATASFGYIWTANRFVTHELTPVSVNYVKLSNTSEEFEQILEDNPFLRSSFNQQFIAGLLYSFTYNGLIDAHKTHQFYLNANLDVAGNALSLFSGEAEGSSSKTFLGLEYAQYAKTDVDIRYHLKVGSEQKIATRLFGGIGIPYGNSDIMPFSKQYFSGGPYSVRAFRIRSLGPGSFNPEEATTNNPFFDRTGNIRLEANIEYRFPIYSFFKGAVFADAGNIWNTDENESVPGGKFESDFMKEMGVGVGVGLRIDIQSFVIRFDLAAPMKTPSLPEGERWNFDIENPILNFAIGYPF